MQSYYYVAAVVAAVLLIGWLLLPMTEGFDGAIQPQGGLREQRMAERQGQGGQHGAKHGLHKLNDAFAALSKIQAELKNPIYTLVNKREIILAKTPITVGSTATDIAFNSPESNSTIVYAPFGYAAQDSFPTPTGGKVLHRVYAIYSDNMTTDGAVRVKFSFGWNNDLGSYEVELPRTWGGITTQRDGHSKFFTIDDMKTGGAQDPTMHAHISAYTTIPNTTAGFHRLFIETWHAT